MNNLVQCLLPSAGFRGISNDFTTAFPLAAISWLKGSPLNMTRLWAIPSSNSSDTTLNISLSGGGEEGAMKQLIEIGVGGNTLHNLRELCLAETQNRSWDVLSAHSIPRPEPCLPSNHAVVYRYILIPQTDNKSPPPVTCESLGTGYMVTCNTIS